MRSLRTVWIALLPLACSGGDDGAGVPPPDVGTLHALLGTAADGRSIPPGGLRVVATEGLEQVVPESISGSDVDMVFAGIDADDLPEGLRPEDLRFVPERDDRARPLPSLRAPHVFSRPSPSDAPSPLVPVDIPELSRDTREERTARLDRLLDDVAIESPCVELVAPIELTTPRTSADLIRVLHTLSNGETLVGFSITSTIVFGRISAGGRDVRLDELPLAQDILQDGEVSEVSWFSDEEFEYDGRRWPTRVTLDVSGGFGSAGVQLVWSEGRQRYLEDTPLTASSAPRTLNGVARIDLDGVMQDCAFGSKLGADRAAAMWCRTVTSTVWTTAVDLPRAVTFTGLVPRASGAHLLVDLAGTIYAFSGNGRWAPVLETSLNAGCDPLCVAFSAFLPRPDGADPIGIMAGARAQLLIVEASGDRVSARRPDALDPALFADERPEAETPLRFTTMTESPDGAIWVADLRPSLFRLDPAADRIERICLPPDLRTVPIASMEAHPDGRLLLGLSPALLGIGDWRR